MGKASSHVGVYRRGRKWQALLCVKGKKTYLGNFPSEEEAAQAVRKARVTNPRTYSIKISKYTGVYPTKRSGKFESKISVKGKDVHLGTYETEEAAAKRFLEALTQYGRAKKPDGVYYGDIDYQTTGPGVSAAAAAPPAVPAPSPAGREAPYRASGTPHGSEGSGARNSQGSEALSSAGTSHSLDEERGAELSGGTASSHPSASGLAPFQLPPASSQQPSSSPTASPAPSRPQSRKLSAPDMMCLPCADVAGYLPQQLAGQTMRTMPGQQRHAMLDASATASPSGQLNSWGLACADADERQSPCHQGQASASQAPGQTVLAASDTAPPSGPLRRGSAIDTPWQRQGSAHPRSRPFAVLSPEATGTTAQARHTTLYESHTLPIPRQAPRQGPSQVPGKSHEQGWAQAAMLQSLGCDSLPTGWRAVRAEKARLAYLRVLLDNRQEELEELQAEGMDQ